MRALCGAIITAGALLGLGLTAIGFGTRYAQAIVMNEGRPERAQLVHMSEMDRPLVFILVFLTIMAIIGLGIAFVGLAYHHHRRHHEMLRDHAHTAAEGRPHVAVPEGATGVTTPEPGR
jgi:hypothetical protein